MPRVSRESLGPVHMEVGWLTWPGWLTYARSHLFYEKHKKISMCSYDKLIGERALKGPLIHVTLDSKHNVEPAVFWGQIIFNEHENFFC